MVCSRSWFCLCPGRALLEMTAYLMTCRTTSSSENAIRSGRCLPSFFPSDTAAIFRRSTPSGIISTPSVPDPARTPSLYSRRALSIASCITRQARGRHWGLGDTTRWDVRRMSFPYHERTQLTSAPGVRGFLRRVSRDILERTPT